MPRTCGVSSRSTDWRILRRPRESSVARWFCLPPIALLTWVILRVATGSPRTLRGRGTVAQHLGGSDVLERQAATGRDLLGPLDLLQRGHRGVHDVDRVVAAQRLAQDVVDAGALQHGTHRATGDDAGTGAG